MSALFPVLWPAVQDLLGDGEKVRTAWTKGGDALLAIDWNNNGAIDGASELFGNATFGASHDDGFRALAELDANGDGKITPNERRGPIAERVKGLLDRADRTSKGYVTEAELLEEIRLSEGNR